MPKCSEAGIHPETPRGPPVSSVLCGLLPFPSSVLSSKFPPSAPFLCPPQAFFLYSRRRQASSRMRSVSARPGPGLQKTAKEESSPVLPLCARPSRPACWHQAAPPVCPALRPLPPQCSVETPSCLCAQAFVPEVSVAPSFSSGGLY